MICLEEKLLFSTNRLISDLTFEDVKYNDLFNALVCLLDVRRRIPSINKWEISFSKFVESQGLESEIRKGLDNFVLAASSGNDLRPWLHDSVFSLENKQDLLMNDWGVQHYHMGLEVGHNGKRDFIKRTSELLYAIHDWQKKTIYLIGVFDHKSFGEKEVLRVANSSWPSLFESSKIRRVESVSTYAISKEDVSKLRKAGINVINDIGGEFYFGPGGGFAVSGHSIEVVQRAISLIKLIKLIEQDISENKLEIDVLVDADRRSLLLRDLTNNRYLDLFQ